MNHFSSRTAHPLRQAHTSPSHFCVLPMLCNTAFLPPTTLGLHPASSLCISPRRPARRALAVRHAQLVAVASPQGVGLSELQAEFDAVNVPPSTCTPPSPISISALKPKTEPLRKLEMDMRMLDELKETYKKAKMAYKQARRACEDSESCDNVDELYGIYKTAKTAYKTSKAAYKLKMKTNASSVCTSGVEKASMSVREQRGMDANTQNACMTVCGGKACTRLGAVGVAAVLGRKAVMDARCMKMCGGVGPTVRVGEELVKVDVRAAVDDALHSMRDARDGGDVGVARVGGAELDGR